MPHIPLGWGFLGLFAGGWKLAMLAGVIAAVFGRRLLPMLRLFLDPTTRITPSRRPTASPAQGSAEIGDSATASTCSCW